MKKLIKHSIHLKNHRKLWIALGSIFVGTAGIVTFASFSTSCGSERRELKYRALNSSTCEVSGTSGTYKNFKVEDLTIPKQTKINGTMHTVTRIGSNAFWGYQGITGRLTLPSTLTEIEESAFYGCKNITGKLILPEMLQVIGASAFFGCNKLSGKLDIPESVTQIGTSAFFECKSISEVKLPSDITTVKSGAFYHCDALTDAVLGNVSIIEPTAFEWCGNLESWKTTGTLSKITDGAFRGCVKLKSISFTSWDPATPSPAIGKQSFLDCGRTTGTVSGSNSAAFLTEARTKGSLPDFWHN